MNIPAAIILFILLISLLRPISFLLYLLFILPVFGALALLPPDMVGGSSLTAGSFGALFFVIKGLVSRDILKGALNSLFNLRQLGFLGLFLVVVVTGAFLLPHVFEGSIKVYSIRTASFDYISLSAANYTQAAYLTLSVLTAAVTASIIRKPAIIEALPKAVLWGAYFVIATGLLDMAVNYLGIPGILSIFYTANYDISGGSILDSHRVLGLTSEPAVYGSMAATFCALLLFLRPVFPPHLWRRNVPIAGWGCGIMAILSTSSTAYVMMIAVLLLYTLYNTHKITGDRKLVKKTLLRRLFPLITLATLSLLIIVFDRDLLSYFGNMLDVLLFNKQSSSSYSERSGWTAAALDAFFTSHGLGIGVGSARTSNFFVNILASTGILGTSLFGLFLTMIFFRRLPKSEPRTRVIINAARLTLIPLFIGLALAGTIPDFGIMTGILFGVIVGLSQSKKSIKRGFSSAPDVLI